MTITVVDNTDGTLNVTAEYSGDKGAVFANTYEAKGEAVFSAQELYRDIIEKANRRATAIVAEAEQKRLAIDGENQRQQDYSVQKVEQCFDRVRRQQQAAMDTLNAAWQDFLCGLYPDEAGTDPEPDADLPEDLSEKVDAIARELFALEN